MAAVDDLLAQIDHTLGDWEVSGDAMRWTPEAQPERKQLGIGQGVRFGLPVYTQPSPEAVARAVDQISTAMAAYARLVERAFAQLAEAGALAGGSFAKFGQQVQKAVDERDRSVDFRARALAARRNRGTGPAGPRLDGRR